MKVYVVSGHIMYEGGQAVAVFYNKENAEKYADEDHEGHLWEHYTVEEFEVQ
ncbi:MAG: hypothetical protein R2685_10490 [Candidatus Nitrosocosmicus sp.]|nr:hypothetical protein [Candidatus Nitrosocosmicus sp.]